MYCLLINLGERELSSIVWKELASDSLCSICAHDLDLLSRSWEIENFLNHMYDVFIQ